MNQTNNYTHDRLQQEVFNYIYNKYPETRGCCWHTPNEFVPDTFVQAEVNRITKKQVPQWLLGIFELAKKNFVTKLAKRKYIGVLPGVTDLVCYFSGCLLMLDVKLPGDSLSEAQQRFITANTKQGGVFIEINTLDQAKQDIDKHFLSLHLKK